MMIIAVGPLHYNILGQFIKRDWLLGGWKLVCMYMYFRVIIDFVGRKLLLKTYLDFFSHHRENGETAADSTDDISSKYHLQHSTIS